MLRINRHFVWTVFLILVVIINLMNVNVVLADDTTPPPSSATEESTQPPVESTQTPVVETPASTDTSVAENSTPSEAPVSTEETPITDEQTLTDQETNSAEILTEIPDNTDLVILDENGNLVPLASQEAVSILEEADPVWCPSSQPVPTPGLNGCTTNQTITNLLSLMRSNAGGIFSANGVIYFERSGITTYTTSFILDDSAASLGASYNTIKAFSITLKGGWNGGATSTFHSTESSIFDNNNNAVVRVGSNANPWIGNVTIQDIRVQDNDGGPGPINGPSVAVYTTTGIITLNDVDVDNQADGQNTALLNSNSGNIVVQNDSTFDGAGINQGFSATTASGIITITGTAANRITFTDAEGSGTGTNYNGTTLSAPTVSLTYVTADGNDLNGIQISNANTITLNNVISTNNGTGITGPDLGSGMRVFGTGTTILTVTGGSFSNNQRYGIETSNVASSTFTGVTFTGNGQGNTVNDNTPPVISPAASCTLPGNGGWCRGTININWNISDPQSAFNSNGCPTTFTTNTPAAGTVLSCSATSTGGTASSSITVFRDSTAPNVNSTKSPNDNFFGWNNTDVVVTFTGTDGNSGIASCTSPITITTEGTNQSRTGSCTDVAGNVGTATESNIDIDKTAPTVNVNRNPTPNANGWNSANVTISFSGSDALSGVSGINFFPLLGCSSPSTVTTEGSNQSRTGGCVDLAGNVTNITVNNINIDKTNPTATASKSPGPNANGWNNSDVVVTFAGIDNLSGIGSCTSPATVSSEGANQSRSGTCTDLAGRVSSTATANNINIDKTPPVITFVSRTPANGNGWNNGNVTVTWSCIDALSGAVNATVSQTITTEGANQSTNGTCQDRAGNTSSDTQSGIYIDKTAPVLNLPANVFVEATGPAGANVNYSALASDNLDATPTLNCLPASGGIYPLGTTPVTCTATDDAGNTSAPSSFNIVVQDTTPPVISPKARMVVTNHNEFGAVVNFLYPSTNDIVDGVGVATCNPPSGSLFLPGDNLVTCTATDAHNNTSSIAFVIHVNYVPLETSALSFGFSGFIPVTGGELIDLDCLTVANAFGIMVTFHNLCDEQAVIEQITNESLPKALPGGYSFVAGLDVQVLDEGQILDFLPENGGVQMDYPLPSEGGYTVLYWNDGQWVEITQLMNDSDLNKMLSTDAENELYKMSSSNNNLFRVLTTDLTGTFVLVKK